MNAQAPNASTGAKSPRPIGLMLSATEAANLLGFSRATFYRWLADGRVPAPVSKCGRSVRWSREALEQCARGQAA